MTRSAPYPAQYERPGALPEIRPPSAVEVISIREYLDATTPARHAHAAMPPRASSADSAFARFVNLTSRERSVLHLMAQGCSNHAISDTLFLSRSAVAKHINSIFTKLGLAPNDADNRRVRAVLTYLEASTPPCPPTDRGQAQTHDGDDRIA